MTKEITFEVYNSDDSFTLETTKVVELPKFDSVEEFSSFLSSAFSNNDTLPPPPKVIVLV